MQASTACKSAYKPSSPSGWHLIIPAGLKFATNTVANVTSFLFLATKIVV